VVEVLAFIEAAFSVDLDASLAAAGPDIEFVAEGVALLAPRYTIEVNIAGSEPRWAGAFFGGNDGVDLIISGPGAETLLAIAGGVAYSVPVRVPADYAVLPMRPVREALCSVDSKIVIMVGYTALLAIDVDGGVLWRTDRLVSDGFFEVRLGMEAVTVRGWDARSDREIEVTVDLIDGRIISTS
jgi:hypothetical protein